MVSRIARGLARQAWSATGRMAGRGSRVKKEVQYQVDLIRRPGRAHGYEHPQSGAVRSRARGHEIYKKSLGVPGFRSRKHHDYTTRRDRNRTVALGVAGLEVTRGLHQTSKHSKKASSSRAKSRRLDKSTAHMTAERKGFESNIRRHLDDAFGPTRRRRR